MNDLIRRKDAIDSPVKMVSEGLEWIPVYHIKELPSAEPGKKGKWQYIGFMVVECSECNTQLHALECANFCPNCGADMREGEQE